MSNVLKGLEADLKRLATRKPALLNGALAETARVMAEQLDSDSSATSKSMCAKQLRDILVDLEALAPAPPKQNNLDKILNGVR